MCTWVWMFSHQPTGGPKITCWQRADSKVCIHLPTESSQPHFPYFDAVPFWTFFFLARTFIALPFLRIHYIKVFHKAHTQYSWYILPNLMRDGLGRLLMRSQKAYRKYNSAIWCKIIPCSHGSTRILVNIKTEVHLQM